MIFELPSYRTVALGVCATQICSSVIMMFVVGVYMFLSNFTSGDHLFPTTGLLPFNSTRLSLVLVTLITVGDILMTIFYVYHVYAISPFGVRFFASWKTVAVIVYSFIFVLTTEWTGSEVFVGLSYVCFCILGIVNAVKLSNLIEEGGESALSAGYTHEEVSATDAIYARIPNVKDPSVQSAVV